MHKVSLKFYKVDSGKQTS